jgi:hypothetical protein
MVQCGSLAIENLDEEDDSMSMMWCEDITCPLSHLAGLTASHIYQGLRRYIPFTSSSNSKLLTNSGRSVLIVISDQASSCKLIKKHEVVFRINGRTVLVIDCGCHGVHLCSHDQMSRLDYPIDIGPTGTAAAVTDEGKGKGKDKGKGKAKVKAAAKAAKAKPKPKAKAAAKAASVKIMSQLVRTSNYCSQFARWKGMLDGVGTLTQQLLDIKAIRAGSELDTEVLREYRYSYFPTHECKKHIRSKQLATANGTK